ncbi:MAG: YerC/YecD family TrpR-related protein [Clostridia bacterium]
MKEKYDKAHAKLLYKGIVGLNSEKECENFFEDLCTISELKSMIQRFMVAKLLKEGVVYSDIVKQTGASTATISRVNKCIMYGTDGYNKVLERIKD